MPVIYVFLLLISLRNVTCVQRSWGSVVNFVPTCFLLSDTIRSGIYTDNSVVVTKGKGAVLVVEQGKREEIRGGRRTLNSGCSKHTATYRRRSIELYARNLHNFINQCHPQPYS